MSKYLFSILQYHVMDIKEEDKSEESKINHIRYFRSLSKTINEIKAEKNDEADPTIKNHLDERIEAMAKDKERIKEMFPNISEEEWNDNPD